MCQQLTPHFTVTQFPHLVPICETVEEIWRDCLVRADQRLAGDEHEECVELNGDLVRRGVGVRHSTEVILIKVDQVLQERFVLERNFA